MITSLAFLTRPFSARMSPNITPYHCLSFKMDTILGTISGSGCLAFMHSLNERAPLHVCTCVSPFLPGHSSKSCQCHRLELDQEGDDKTIEVSIRRPRKGTLSDPCRQRFGQETVSPSWKNRAQRMGQNARHGFRICSHHAEKP